MQLSYRIEGRHVAERKTCGASFDTEREKTVTMAEMATEMFGFR